MKRVMALAVSALLLLSGCGSEKGATQHQTFFTGTDSLGHTFVLDKKPERVAVLAPSLIEILDAIGADYIAYADSPGRVLPSSTEGKVSVGPLYRVNTEALMGANPDFVVGFDNIQDMANRLFESRGVPVAVISLMSYDDLRDSIIMLGKALDRTSQAESVVAGLDKDMEGIVESVPHRNLTCVIVHGNGKGLTVERNRTVAIDVARRFGLTILFLDEKADTERVPFSMEELAKANPDIILFTSMVKPGKEAASFQKWMTDQPAWQTVDAVRKGRVYMLPQNLFLSPGLDFVDSMRYMATVLERDAARTE